MVFPRRGQQRIGARHRRAALPRNWPDRRTCSPVLGVRPDHWSREEARRFTGPPGYDVRKMLDSFYQRADHLIE
jgi:hypothetical protein